jgi:hypothetical protein
VSGARPGCCPTCGTRQPLCAYCLEPFSEQRPPWRFPAGPFAGLEVHRATCELDLVFAHLAAAPPRAGAA